MGSSRAKKTLVVVESPHKGKTLRGLLGARFTMKVCAEPLVDLPRNRLGIDLDNGLIPEHVRTASSMKAAKLLREAAREADRVCLAFDPDRRGEAHASYVVDALGKKGSPVERVILLALTEDAVRTAFAAPRELVQGKIDAFVAEQVIDRLVAQLVSPILRSHVRRELVADRVGVIALGRVVERERALAAMVAEAGVDATLPLDCAQLVELAWRGCGLSSSQTIATVRRLYEGLPHAGGRSGLVTWPFDGVVRPSDPAYPPTRVRAELEGGADGDREQLREVAESVAVYALVWAAHAGKAVVPPSKNEAAPRHTDGALLAALGTGRAERGARALGALELEGCVVRRDGRLAPTLLGTQVSDLLGASFAKSLAASLSQALEEGLSQVERGEASSASVVARFYAAFEPELRVAAERARTQPRGAAPTGAKCPRCDSKMVVKWGKNGEFLACTTYPVCTATQELERGADGVITAKPETTTTEQCPACDKPMVIRRGRYGEFLACSAYPGCKTTQPISLGVACPRPGCGGFLAEKRSRRGQIFYGCASYARTRCDFVSWDRPVAERCPRCGAGFLVRKETQRGATLRCVAEGCGHVEVGRRGA